MHLFRSILTSGADGSVVLGVAEQHHPAVANEFMEVNWAGRGLCLEIGRGAAQAKAKVKVLAIIFTIEGLRGNRVGGKQRGQGRDQVTYGAGRSSEAIVSILFVCS